MVKISEKVSADPASALDGTEGFHVAVDLAGTPLSKGATISQVGDYVANREETPSWAKKVCRVATTGNHSLSGLADVDGKTISDGSRILVRAQTDPSENGIYVAAAGAWSRASVMNTANEAAAAVVAVRFGSTYGGTVWTTDFDGDDTLDTTAMNWSRIPSLDLILNQSNTWATGTTQAFDGPVVINDVMTINGVLSVGDEAHEFFDTTDPTKTWWLFTNASHPVSTAIRYTMPPASANTTLVSIDGTQTITNKTLALGSNTISGTKGLPFEMVISLSDVTSDLTVGATKESFRMPRAVTISKVKGSLITAATGATLVQFDVNKNGSTIFSTNPTFDASETTTETAATPSVISGTTVNFAADDVISFDIDAIGNTTAGKGLRVTLIGVYQ
jgi:hypothetical protein